VRLVEDLLDSVAHLDCPVTRVCVGLHWTVVESRHVGVAHTYKTNRKVELTASGDLIGRSALELATRLRSWEPLEASLGVAALNSLIEAAGNPGDVLEHVMNLARGRTITVVGRFPFNPRIREAAAQSYFLETDPGGTELPAWACEEVIPASDVVVITASTLINKTLSRLLELGRGATTIVLGPSTPMNDVLLRHGASILAGIRVTDPDALFRAIMQGVKRFARLEGVEAISRELPRD
jgi:uncharacterized protein (DUF4213/DUF364 family)